MKTTIDVPDPIYRQVKARAALEGRSMKAFILDALRSVLARSSEETGAEGWRAVFGQAPAGSIDAVQAEIDREFSRIDPEGWE